MLDVGEAMRGQGTDLGTIGVADGAEREQVLDFLQRESEVLGAAYETQP